MPYKKQFSKPTKEILSNLYCLGLKPMHEVAKALGMSTGSVYNYLHKYGLPVRPQKETFTFKGRKLNENQRNNLSKIHKGKKLSNETKSKISKSNKGKFRNKSEFGGHRKKRSDGYIKVYLPDHPMATKDGYVMEHILVMEKHIGRIITRSDVVHHVNKIRDDNRIENLKLMTFKEHSALHMKERHDKRRNKN